MILLRADKTAVIRRFWLAHQTSCQGVTVEGLGTVVLDHKINAEVLYPPVPPCLNYSTLFPPLILHKLLLGFSELP